MEALELVLLFDYYGDLLTDRMRECFDLRYNQDLSLGEIGQILGISRQDRVAQAVQTHMEGWPAGISFAAVGRRKFAMRPEGCRRNLGQMFQH